jgi:hypothetical protein
MPPSPALKTDAVCSSETLVYLSPSPNAVTTHVANNDNFTAVKTSDLINVTYLSVLFFMKI